MAAMSLEAPRRTPKEGWGRHRAPPRFWGGYDYISYDYISDDHISISYDYINYDNISENRTRDDHARDCPVSRKQ
jgi:hypothetical protein